MAFRRVLLLALLVLTAVVPDAHALTVRTNPFTLGQAPDWLDDSHVVAHAPTADGDVQIFRSTLRGTARACLTCGLAGPNQVPVVQPRGKWILFHSWNGHAVRVGSPGFGGLGSDVWVMTRDGRRRTNLTPSPDLHDNFHAYWSPNGGYITWTALNWNAADGGTGRSEIRVGRFEARGPRGPRLVDVHVVRPSNGHWYETQWWAPDGSGFLYTETYDTALNPELFFCRLDDPARGACRPQRLTRNPAWDEQAVFTPDIRSIVFMSTRGHPGALENWTRLATLIDLPATYDYALVLPVFSRSFLEPVFSQADDLYELPLRWNARRTSFRPAKPRRLTRSGDRGWVIPEFALDPSGRRLLWTQVRLRGRVDERSVLRRIRDRIVDELSAVHGVGGLPVSIFDDVAEQVGEVLRNPSAFAPKRPPPSGRDTRTVIARLR